MRGFLLRRAISALPTIAGATLVAFLLLNLLPADPLHHWTMSGPPPSAEARAWLEAALAPERPLLARYLDWAAGLLRADLGRSVRDGRPVTEVLAASLPWTVLLNGAALLLILGLAIPCGALGAAAAGSRLDRLGGAFLLALYALPPFAAALALQEVFAVRLRILPLHGTGGGAGPPGAPVPLLDLARHLALPAVCLALSGWAFVARYTRAAFAAALERGFPAAARARGASRRRAVLHAAAGAAVPLLTLLAAVLPGLVGGSVIIEQVFSWPGVGRLYLEAIEARDYPVVLGLTLVAALVVLLVQGLVDLLYLAADPRTRDPLLAGERRG